MGYRDDHQARTARCSELERQLADLRRRKTEWHALEAAIAELERELSLQRSLLHRQSLPVLDNLRVASPCDMDWEKMSGDSRVRFCGKCAKHVYNLSNMTRTDGEALIREKEGQVCVRFYQRSDGTVLTTDCPVGVRRLRFRRMIAASAGASALIAGFMTLSAFRMGAPERLPPPPPPLPVEVPCVHSAVEPPTVTMGDIAPPVVPQMGHMAPAKPMPKSATHMLMGKVRYAPPPPPVVPMMGSVMAVDSKK